MCHAYNEVVITLAAQLLVRIKDWYPRRLPVATRQNANHPFRIVTHEHSFFRKPDRRVNTYITYSAVLTLNR